MAAIFDQFYALMRVGVVSLSHSSSIILLPSRFQLMSLEGKTQPKLLRAATLLRFLNTHSDKIP